MFGEIAPRYDRLNRVLSLGFDRRWRAELVEAIVAARPRRILDVATGTADLALALKQRLPEADVTGIDVAEPMLEVGRRKAASAGVSLHLEVGDGMALPYDTDSFDAITIAYGLRNFSDRLRGLGEFFRVLRPGGRLAVLDFPPLPPGPLHAPIRLYCRWILPRIGAAVSGHPSAYTYLPASTDTFPAPAELARIMTDVGFHGVDVRVQTFGISALHLGDVPS
jgi:demethylmenaquinone methyltransferase/2-methoxy-6-polyprenyl-1,4-benzoquinol methylase